MFFRCVFSATTASRFFRIDRAQEHLHYITDISCEDLYVMDPELQSSLLLRNTGASGRDQQYHNCYSSPNLLNPESLMLNSGSNNHQNGTFSSSNNGSHINNGADSSSMNGGGVNGGGGSGTGANNIFI